jgi:ribosomal protein S18 acetylase RimI-like enzyme
MPAVNIRTFGPGDWQDYRDLRLSALQDSPDAFGSTYADAVVYPDSVWRSRLHQISSEFDCPLVAERGGRCVGLAWGRIEASHRDVAHLFQMWVAPDHRGLGISRKLLDSVISWAVAQDAASLVLAVTCGDTPASRLYESAGFEAFGKPEPLRAGSAVEVQPMKLNTRSYFT